MLVQRPNLMRIHSEFRSFASS